MTVQRRWAGFRADRSQEGGYVAVMTALLLVVLMGLAAFAVDVGRWYVVGQQAQRAADAAALAGVPSLPANLNGAKNTAKNFSKINGFQDLVAATTVTPELDGGRPTRLRVTVSRTVDNIFGPLLGLPKTTVSRTAVADFGGPIPMGSPCNTFGNDPDPGSNRGASCSGVLGQMWANVNGPSTKKVNGDAYQSVSCSGGEDGCSGTTNTDYTADGYFYTVSVKAAGMLSLTIQLFDPVFVNVGLTCGSNFGSGTTEAVDALNGVVSDATTRYKSGASEPYCTGDGTLGDSKVINTQFTVRKPSPNLWNPSTFPLQDPACQKTYPGYNGPLFDVLDQASASTYNKDSTGSSTSPTIVDGFRRWTTLCTIPNPVVGDYLVQVKTNVGSPYDSADASNHFSIRAYGSNNDAISISGRERMGVFSNKPSVTTEFHLARVPTGAAGQMLNVRLYDVGDSRDPNTNQPIDGKIRIVYPPYAAGGPSFTDCQGAGPVSGTLTNCSFTANSNTHNGRWQTISVRIPANYSCTDSDPTMCWVRLEYFYGTGSAPTDVTTWNASLDGDPVRLVE